MGRFLGPRKNCPNRVLNWGFNETKVPFLRLIIRYYRFLKMQIQLLSLFSRIHWGIYQKASHPDLPHYISLITNHFQVSKWCMLCDWRIKKWNLLHSVSTKMIVFNSNFVFAQICDVCNQFSLSLFSLGSHSVIYWFIFLGIS